MVGPVSSPPVPIDCGIVGISGAHLSPSVDKPGLSDELEDEAVVQHVAEAEVSCERVATSNEDLLQLDLSLDILEFERHHGGVMSELVQEDSSINTFPFLPAYDKNNNNGYEGKAVHVTFLGCFAPL